MAKFRIDPARSTIAIRATSSVHPIEGESSGVEGEIEVAVADGELAGPPSAMWVELPVDTLSSGKLLYDREMRRRIDARKYPTISGEATSVEGNGDTFRVTGHVTFHGQTNTESDEVRIAVSGDTLHITGSHSFDIRDYGVDPPKILMLKVHPDVAVEIDLHATVVS